MSSATEIKLDVNGREMTLMSEADRPLLEVLREDLNLTGTKFGCGEGACGACSVLINGKRTFSCSTAVSEVIGKKVVTIEGLVKGEELHPVQAAFLEEGSFQCGYCTGGMIMGAVALLDRKPSPSDKDILDWMNGQLCRCCTYPKIFAAIRKAADQIGKGK